MWYVFVCDIQCGITQAVLSVLCDAPVPMSVNGEFGALLFSVVLCVVEGVLWMVCFFVISV